MSYTDWKEKVKEFKTMDVRNMQGNFFPSIKKMASERKVGEGLEIIQTFEPHPLYPTMEDLGFEHYVEEIDKNEFHVYFYRVEAKNEDTNSPFKPLALLNFPMIDEDLGNVAMEFWNITWGEGKRTLPYETRLLLSLANAVGAGRMRQATRELIKAYVHGVTSKEFDDLFELFAWNQGIGYFSSEIGPSTLFQAYKLIKNGEKQGKSHHEIKVMLMDKFGENNPEISVK